MTVYLGKNPVGVGRIVEKKVAKEKFGATVDNFLGDVDADGNYVEPAAIEEINLVGVKSIGIEGLRTALAGKKIKRFLANNVEYLGASAMYGCFDSSTIEQASFDGIEEINKDSVFAKVFNNCYYLRYLSFKKLKKQNGPYAFQYALTGASALTMTYDEIFPSLEEASGARALDTGRSYKANDVITFSKIKKITGGSATYNNTFGSISAKDTVWNFPSATEFTGYIWNVSASYAGEIHFAAANQAAIEACEGYDYKWGFAGATIFWDL